MRRMICKYPGDPPVEVVEMTRAEFLARFPDRGTTITSAGPDGVVTSEYYAAPPDAIYCDSCNDDPGSTVYLYAGSRGYCPDCFRDSLEEYCKPAEPYDRATVERHSAAGPCQCQDCRAYQAAHSKMMDGPSD